ncbi:MAG: class I SAM-dependent methyltransferase [Lutibacter sp.]|uniref:class I SAM-dependent DNA methyltransferase n=1 Tax=Lutibacter sp. TaxID=1925666 RepID=UPI0017F505C1|nr:class I SAM-dependent methyltransferase [Lutibacter sp.]MBT8316548.1 class I SAM-dependent methyltransferase [Lutibacter sp.]NNJ57408.1 class I SAM-dependent methyltransferase [Lutibacter sp.]
MKHFDKQAKDWDKNPMKVERAKIFANEIIDFIKPKPTNNALEFGCGTGLLSYQLKDNFETITLADNSEGMIEVLKDKVKNLSIKNFKPLLVDLLKENLDIGKFNVIYSLMTVHHIIDLKKVAQIFHSLLEHNGYLCIADLVKEDGSFHINHPDFDGHNGFDKKELSEILISNGFKIEYYNISYVIEKELENKIRKYPLFLMICKKV